MKKSKSRLFADFRPSDETREDIVRDIAVLLSLPEKVINELPAHLSSFIVATYEDERRDLVKSLADIAGRDLADIKGVFRLLAFFARGSIDDDKLSEDAPSDWVDDLINEDLLVVTHKGQMLHVLELVKEKVGADLLAEAMSALYETGIVPTLTGHGTTVELRGIQKSKYRPFTPLSNYEPIISGLVSVVTVSLVIRDTDRKEPERVVFQATEKQLEDLINVLKASLEDARALKNSYRELEVK